MKKTVSLSPAPTRRETGWGFAWLFIQLFVLPVLLTVVSVKLRLHLDAAQTNFVFFLFNFLAVVTIFHRFLGRSAKAAAQHPAIVCQAVILGAVGHFATNFLLGILTAFVFPDFTNANDASISVMSRNGWFLMALGTVVLVPPVEETLFRGLIFRNLYGKSKFWAFAVSMAAFSCIHVVNFLGIYSPAEFVYALFLYLPIGYWLAWAYLKSGTIFAPILIHAIINAVGMAAMR